MPKRNEKNLTGSFVGGNGLLKPKAPKHQKIKKFIATLSLTLFNTSGS